MIAEAYVHEYDYWLKEEYLIDLETADLEKIKIMYARWNKDTFGVNKSSQQSIIGFWNYYMKLVRNPLVRMYNKLISLDKNLDLSNEMIERIINLEDYINIVLNLSKKRRK